MVPPVFSFYIRIIHLYRKGVYPFIVKSAESFCKTAAPAAVLQAFNQELTKTGWMRM